MEYKIEKLPQSKISLKVILVADEMKKYGEMAIAHFVEHTEIKGFRQGKAPRHLVIEHIGQNRINSEAINVAVENSYGEIVVKDNIEVIAHPQIEVLKFVPNQCLEYKAGVAILPEAKLADYKTIAKDAGKNDMKEVKVEDEETEKALDWLADSRAKYENGKITERPQINDDFAKSLGGFAGLEELKKNIKEGILLEKNLAEKERFRIALISKIAADSKMEIPDILIERELDKMMHELKHDVEHRGMEFDKYLEHIKKTEENLKKELFEKAKERTRIALAMKEISKAEDIAVSNEELAVKMKEIATRFGEDAQNIDESRLSEYTKNIIVNEKVFELLEKLATTDG